MSEPTVTFADLQISERKELAALAQSAQQARDIAEDSKRSTFLFRACVATTIASFVLFIVGNIYVQRWKYPALFKWYDEMRKETPQGEATPNYSMYQVVTSAEYTPVAYMLTVGIWTELDRKGALFLMQTVAYFNEQATTNPKMRLTARHWNGSKRQNRAISVGSDVGFLGPNGWGCSAPASRSGSASMTLGQRQAALVDQWRASGSENIWYEFYPDTFSDAGYQAFLDVPAIQDLYQSSASDNDASDNSCSNAGIYGHMYKLYDGGLCAVAFSATKADQSASELFAYYFVGSPSPKPSCGGVVAQGAVTGATGLGMMSLGLMAIPGIRWYYTGFVALAGGIGGGVTGGLAAKDNCENSAAVSGASAST